MRRKWWVQDQAADDAGTGSAAGGAAAGGAAAGAAAGAKVAGVKTPAGSGGDDAGAAAGAGKGGNGHDKDVAAGTAWPDNWRELYSGADDKKAKRLERYASPSAVFDALIAAQNKISSGELKAAVPFPEKGTDEEKADWRKAHGVPEAADKYNLDFGNGLVLGEEDEPVVKSFLTAAHEANIPNDTAKVALKWYVEERDRQAEAQYQADLAFKVESEDALRAEWGADFTRNRNLIKNLLAEAPSGVADRLLQGRLADGKPVGSDPDVLRFLIGLSLQLNPQGTVLPGAGGDRGAAIEDEIKKIEEVMRTDRKKYNTDEKMQARLRDLYAARERQAGKSKAA